MGGSLIINVLVYQRKVSSSLTFSVGFKTNIGDSPNIVFGVYTPSGGSPESFSVNLNTLW